MNSITLEPGKRGGRPCIRGLRISVFKTAVLWLVLLAVGTECLQHFIPGRGASVADLMADVAGLALSGVAWRALQRRAGAVGGVRGG